MIQENHKTKQADSSFIRQLMSSPLLEKDEEQDLALLWQQQRNTVAFAKLVSSFTRLVVSMALRFRFYGIPLTDLIQEGIIGLIYAAERFDTTKNVRFSSYAKWWIRATIQDYVLRNWSIVRTGTTTAQKQLFFNLNRLKNQLSHLSLEGLSDSDKKNIAENLNLSIHDIDDMEKRLLMTDFSLSHDVSESSNQNWQDLLKDGKMTPDAVIEESDTAVWHQFWLDTAFSHLDERERRIIYGRRLKERPETLESLSKALHLSKERIRQLETKALRKMRHALMNYVTEVKDSLS